MMSLSPKKACPPWGVKPLIYTRGVFPCEPWVDGVWIFVIIVIIVFCCLDSFPNIVLRSKMTVFMFFERYQARQLATRILLFMTCYAQQLQKVWKYLDEILESRGLQNVVVREQHGPWRDVLEQISPWPLGLRGCGHVWNNISQYFSRAL